MKKVLILLLCFLCLPCLADNSIQKKFEQDFYTKYFQYSKKDLIQIINFLIVKQDYETYLENEENETFYSDLIILEKTYCGKTDNQSIIKCKYAKKIKTNADNLMNSDVESFFNSNIPKTTSIIIEDKDIKYLDENLILYTFFLNPIK